MFNSRSDTAFKKLLVQQDISQKEITRSNLPLKKRKRNQTIIKSEKNYFAPSDKRVQAW